MSLLHVDRKICHQEGICVSVCPLRLILMDEDGYPSPIPEADETCIRCGHCVAACPKGALSHSDLNSAMFEPVDDSLKIGPEQSRQLIKGRRSVRSFKERALSKEKLFRLIETADYAPTARNSQDVEWVVICDRNELKNMSSMVVDFFRLMIERDVPGSNLNPHLTKLIKEYDSGIDVILHNTPALIIAHGKKDDYLASIDSIIAMSNLELAAFGMGLGCCWAGFFMAAAGNHGPLIEALSLPADRMCYGAMMTGYPRFKYYRLPARKVPVITWRM